MKKRILIFTIPIIAMALAIPSIVSASSPPGLTASLLGAYNGSDWANNPPLSCGDDTLVTNSSELAKLDSSDDSRLCSSTAGNYDFHRFVFEIPSCVTHISLLHEGYGNGTEVAGHALYVWNGSAWEIPPVASTNSSGPPDHELTGELTGNFSKYIQNGTLNLLAIATYTNGTLCTDYVRVGTTCPVGGEVLPINKVSILAPWLALGTLMAVSMAVLVIMKRRRLA